MRVARFIYRACFLLLLFSLAGCAVNPVTGKRELSLFQVSDAQEVELGKKSFPSALQQMGGAYPDARLEAYVQTVGAGLARYSSRPGLPWSFKVINDSSPNAFAVPGGYIAISRGLLVNLENEAQLAAVLGHEVAHVDARHSVQGMQRGALLDATLAVLSGVAGESVYGPLTRQAGELAAGMLDRSYSRDQERESDQIGIDYMVRAGYNPQGAVQLQEFFYRQLEGGADPNWVAGLFRTHPFSKERLEANKAYIARRYAGVAVDPGARFEVAALKSAIAELSGTSEGYALYDQARRLEGQGDLSAAVSTYLQAAAAAPDQALILTGLGTSYLKSGDVRSARLHLARAVQLDPDYFNSRLGLGYVYLQQKDAREAVVQLEKSMSLLPTLQGAYLLAEGYEGVGRNNDALALYRQVAEADPRGKLGQAAVRRINALEGR